MILERKQVHVHVTWVDTTQLNVDFIEQLLDEAGKFQKTSRHLTKKQQSQKYKVSYQGYLPHTQVDNSLSLTHTHTNSHTCTPSPVDLYSDINNLGNSFGPRHYK